MSRERNKDQLDPQSFLANLFCVLLKKINLPEKHPQKVMTTVDQILPVEKNGLCIRQVGDVWGNKKWYLKITLNIKFLW